MVALIGQRLGQYEITGQLGQGGMATVYRARQLNIARDVAIKVIKANLIEDDDFLSRFEREAQTIATLSHPHILKLFDYGQHNGTAYLVTELLTGGSLQDQIRGGPLPVATVGRLLDQLASALNYAHERGIIHRDLKPQNVLLDADHNAILTDFGIAKLLHQTTQTKTGTTVGTPAYMAPEQWRSDPIEARADVYALGIMLFEMLTGKLPFKAETSHAYMYQHLYEPPPSVLNLKQDLPAGVERVLIKALEKDPALRFESALALASAYSAAVRGQPYSLSAPLVSPLVTETETAIGPTLPEPADTATHVLDKPKRGVQPPVAEAKAKGLPSPLVTAARVLLFGATAILIAVPVLHMLRTGDSALETSSSAIALITLLAAVLPLLGARIVGEWRVLAWRPMLYRTVPLALQALVLVIVGFGAGPLSTAYAGDVLARARNAATSGNAKLTSDLLWELAVLSPLSAQKLAGDFNDQGVDALASNALTQARVYLEAVQRLDDDSTLDVGRSKAAESGSRYMLGYLREFESNPQAAIVLYREAIALDDANFEARYALSSLLLINNAQEVAALDEAVSVAHAGWFSYIPASFCLGRQNLADDDVFQKSWHCFRLKTVEAGARLKRGNLDRGDTPSEIETLARSAINLAESNDEFHSHPGYFTAEAYYYLAQVTAPNTDVVTLCHILRNYDSTNPRHHAWAEYADKQLAGQTCPA